MDHYDQTWPKIDLIGQTVAGGFTFVPPQLSAEELATLRLFIAEFREAVTAAAFLDRLLGKPDCVDPEKEKLVARVAELEAQLDAVKKVLTPVTP